MAANDKRILCTHCKGKKYILMPTIWSEKKCDYIDEKVPCPACGGLGSVKPSAVPVDESALFYRPKGK